MWCGRLDTRKSMLTIKPLSVIWIAISFDLLTLEHVALSCLSVALAKTEADAGAQLTIFDSSASEK